MPVLESRNRRILYLHVPKTGGVSVEETLVKLGRVTLLEETTSRRFPCAAQHWHADVLRSLFKDGAEFASVFMTTRHPFARLESEYWYRISGYSRLLIPSFERWVRKTLNTYRKNPYVYVNHIRPQVEFEVFNPTVFKLEDGFQKIANYLADVLKLPSVPAIGHHNVGRSKAPVEWSKGLQNRVRDFYRQDFERFGYD